MIPLIKDYLEAHKKISYKLSGLVEDEKAAKASSGLIHCWIKALPGFYKVRTEKQSHSGTVMRIRSQN